VYLTKDLTHHLNPYDNIYIYIVYIHYVLYSVPLFRDNRSPQIQCTVYKELTIVARLYLRNTDS
jgi:hypothetical protein